MNHALRSVAALAAVLAFTGYSAAQSSPAGAAPPGSGFVTLDNTAPAAGSSLQNPQPAECLGQPAGPWTVVAPYAWIFGIKGTVGAGRVTQQVDMTVADAFDQLSNLKGAAQLHIESGYGNVGLIADLTYLKIQPLDGLVRAQSESTIFELLGMYRLFDTGGRQAGAATLDVLAGGRYYRFSNNIEGNFAGLLSAERTDKWIDLVVGARAGVQVLDNLGIFARGDIGGFGIGHSSQSACNVVVGFDCQLCECASLVGGYRWLKINRESGEGRDRFLLDATLSGPFMAFSLRF